MKLKDKKTSTKVSGKKKDRNKKQNIWEITIEELNWKNKLL